MDRQLGAIFSPKDVRDYRAVAAQSVELPNSYEINMKGCRVKDQGSVGSCVAHTLSSVVEYYNYKETQEDIAASTNYIYGNRTNSLHKGKGMITRDALANLRNWGDVFLKDSPYNTEVPDCIDRFTEVAASLYDKGRRQRISTYSRLYRTKDIKQAIVSGCPVVMAMDWYDDMEVEDDILISAYRPQDDCGGHCMLLYGYNETGWLVQNSWGKDWGDNGRCIIPYDADIREFWAISDTIVEGMKIKRPFSSAIGKYIALGLNSFWKWWNKNFS